MALHAKARQLAPYWWNPNSPFSRRYVSTAASPTSTSQNQRPLRVFVRASPLRENLPRTPVSRPSSLQKHALQKLDFFRQCSVRGHETSDLSHRMEDGRVGGGAGAGPHLP